MSVTSTNVVECAACGTKNRVPASAKGSPRCGRCRSAVPWVADADDDSFDDIVSAPVPVLIDLWAPWCGPCKMVSPALDQIARDRAGKMKLVKVNVDEAPGVAQRFGSLRAWLDGAMARRPRAQ